MNLRFFLKRVPLSATVAFCLILCFQLSFISPVRSDTNTSAEIVKELNFVFLHGGGGVSCTQQLLADTLLEKIPEYIQEYNLADPGTRIKVNILNRCYPGDVDIETWANNVADSIEKHLPSLGKIILVGHSMGGKVALYTAANDIGGIADRVALVVTIDSPILKMEEYKVTGGGSFIQYCQARWLSSDIGICNSIAFYDSTADGKWVAENRHWLALISAESSPLSSEFNYGGVDPYPRDMDDGAIPLTAQYTDDADVVYYGGYYHSDFGTSDEVAELISGNILKYIFGGLIECSVFADSGTLTHKARRLLGTDYWQDTTRDVIANRGTLWHRNKSFSQWQEWEDIVTYDARDEDRKRSRFEVARSRSSTIFTGIEESRWFDPENPSDFRLYIRSKAPPGGVIRIDWNIYRRDLLPVGVKRNHYEIEITAGTSLSGISDVSWASDDPRDTRLQISSQAESPFRWFESAWRVYSSEKRQRKIIDEIPVSFNINPDR
jgi:pimeloyl-ACP methyl ester carboxylesterase